MKKEVFTQQAQEAELVKKLNNLKNFYANQKKIREDKELKEKKEKEKQLKKENEKLQNLAFDKEKQYSIIEECEEKLVVSE